MCFMCMDWTINSATSYLFHVSSLYKLISYRQWVRCVCHGGHDNRRIIDKSPNDWRIKHSTLNKALKKLSRQRGNQQTVFDYS